MVQITFDPAIEEDCQWVLSLLTGDEEPAADEPEPEAKPAAKRGKAKAAPEPEPEKTPLEQAADLATDLVAKGKTVEVKAILADYAVKRVSELDESDLPAFIEALEAIEVEPAE